MREKRRGEGEEEIFLFLFIFRDRKLFRSGGGDAGVHHRILGSRLLRDGCHRHGHKALLR